MFQLLYVVISHFLTVVCNDQPHFEEDIGDQSLFEVMCDDEPLLGRKSLEISQLWRIIYSDQPCF